MPSILEGICTLSVKFVPQINKLKSEFDALIQNHQWHALSDLLSSLEHSHSYLTLEQIKYLRLQYSPSWWMPIDIRGLSLERRSEVDYEFMLRAYGDNEFVSQFAGDFRPKNLTNKDKFLEDLKNEFLTPPLVQKSASWIVKRNNESLGIISLANINLRHRFAELLVGFPDKSNSYASVFATLTVIDLAFNKLHFEKLISFVLQDNVLSQKSTLSLGFTQEGLLRGEYLSTGNVRLSVYRNGLLKEDFNSIDSIIKKRFMNCLNQSVI